MFYCMKAIIVKGESFEQDQSSLTLEVSQK